MVLTFAEYDCLREKLAPLADRLKSGVTLPDLRGIADEVTRLPSFDKDSIIERLKDQASGDKGVLRRFADALSEAEMKLGGSQRVTKEITREGTTSAEREATRKLAGELALRRKSGEEFSIDSSSIKVGTANSTEVEFAVRAELAEKERDAASQAVRQRISTVADLRALPDELIARIVDRCNDLHSWRWRVTKLLSKAQQEGPWMVRRAQADAALTRGDWTNAIQKYQEAVESCKAPLALRRMRVALAECYRATGAPQRGIDLLDPFRADTPAGIRGCYEAVTIRTRCLIDLRKYEAAIQERTRAERSYLETTEDPDLAALLRLPPWSWEIEHARALALNKEEEPAVEAIRKAIQSHCLHAVNDASEKERALAFRTGVRRCAELRGVKRIDDLASMRFEGRVERWRVQPDNFYLRNLSAFKLTNVQVKFTGYTAEVDGTYLWTAGNHPGAQNVLNSIAFLDAAEPVESKIGSANVLRNGPDGQCATKHVQVYIKCDQGEFWGAASVTY